MAKSATQQVRTHGRRVVVIGLDSVPPDLLFDRFLPEMPNLKALMQRGVWGTLRTTDPPITIPAWAVMFSGVDPGTLGLYGFRHRRPGTYFDEYTPSPKLLAEPALWSILSRDGYRVCVIGMPPGYPPPTVNGVYVSDILTPDHATDTATPPAMVEELRKVAPGYTFDITFRAEDRERISKELFTMTQARFALARHLLQKEPWDLFAIHEIGPDRLHHAFWKYFDSRHPRHVPGSPFADLARRYYRLMDEEIGKLVALVGPETSVLIASDHGSQGMSGCFCINEWLIQKGYLVLQTPPKAPGLRLEQAQVDWRRTTAWGAGGYYARINFNVAGREPNGIVAPDDVPQLIERLTRELGAVTKPDGRPLGVKVHDPKVLYRNVRGDPPDLMLYFGDVDWRSAGTLGHGRLFLEENDTGPDDAVHSFEGIYLFLGGSKPGGRHGLERAIIDVAPTLMRTLGLDVPATMQGRPIEDWL